MYFHQDTLVFSTHLISCRAQAQAQVVRQGGQDKEQVECCAGLYTVTTYVCI